MTIVLDLTSPFSHVPKLMLRCCISSTERTHELRMIKSRTGRSARSVSALLNLDRSKSSSLMNTRESARLARVVMCGRVDPLGVMTTMSWRAAPGGTEMVRAETSLPVAVRLDSSLRSEMLRRTNCSSSSRVECEIDARLESCCSMATSSSSTVILLTSAEVETSVLDSARLAVRAGDLTASLLFSGNRILAMAPMVDAPTPSPPKSALVGVTGD